MLKEITVFIGENGALVKGLGRLASSVPDKTDKSKIRKQLSDEDTKPATVIKKMKSTLIAKSFFLLLLKKKSCT